MNMRQGSKNDNGLVRIGFLYTRKQPAGFSEPGQFNKTGFLTQTRPVGSGPKSQTQKKPRNQLQTQNHRSHNIHVIFLAITAFSWKFSCHPNGCQDLTNQSVQQIPVIKRSEERRVGKECRP